MPSPSAADLPDLAEQDVIRTAFIYDPAPSRSVGASKVLSAKPPSATPASRWRRPSRRRARATAAAFGVIVNHFKSKGSGTDDATGQGNANPDRVAQANELADFADQFKTDARHQQDVPDR